MASRLLTVQSSSSRTEREDPLFKKLLFPTVSLVLSLAFLPSVAVPSTGHASPTDDSYVWQIAYDGVGGTCYVKTATIPM